MVTGKRKDQFWKHNTIWVNECKPILRRLEDMTEGERVDIFGQDVHWYKPFDTADACDIQQWHKLLQKGFDIFGLLDAGLAIDSKNNR